jgi:adenine-specific DNA-methyltransferase
VHRVRAVMDEVFGEENCISEIVAEKTSGASMRFLDSVSDYVIWFGKNKDHTKYRPSFELKNIEDFDYEYKFRQDEAGHRDAKSRFSRGEPADRVYAIKPLTSQTDAKTTRYEYNFRGSTFLSGKRQWATPISGMDRLTKSNRVEQRANSIGFVRFFDDFAVVPRSNIWTDTGTGSFTDDKVYIVQTGSKIIQRCILMTTDPGDLVLDPTCGSGTTATVAEQWGRRWITIDTSRVALALARTRLMSARYAYYLLKDSPEGVAKEQVLTGKIQSDAKTHGDIRQGFVYERAPHITLKSIANNAEIDVIWERWQEVLEPIREGLNAALSTDWQEWQIPRDLDAWLDSKDGAGKAGLVSAEVRKLHAAWWEARIARQREIDASIARAADVEYLYDRPYEDKSRVRVAGPFTVESLSPHRVMTARDDTLGDELLAHDGALARLPKSMVVTDFGEMVLENLRASGVQQQDKAGRIAFSHIEPWPGTWLSAIGTYADGSGTERRAGILIGPEFGTLTRGQITAGAREAAEARLDALIACAFNYDAQATDLVRLGPLAILKARMNPDLHMADDLKNTGKGNLFVVFGEPDVELKELNDGKMQVKVLGVDVFDPSNGEIRSDGIDGIAAWFIDTDYNEESFFVRHAYFLGAAKSGDSDPYKSLKTALRAEIDEEAWASLYSDVSRPFERPSTGRIAVKVINHFGDEVLKVFGV